MLAMSIDQLTAEAMALTPEERLTLAHTFYNSVPPGQEDAEFDPEYMQEILHRAEELESGKAVGIPWEEVMASARREIGCD